MAEIREAVPGVLQPKPPLFSETATSQGCEAELQVNSMILRKKPKKADFVKMGLRLFSWVLIGTGVPYYAYYLWKGDFYFPESGEEKIAGFFLVVALFLMMIGSQRKKC